MSKPTVTIGMPVYNGERYLAGALDCIQEQDFEDFEVVISDNASTDATEAICRERARSDRRFRYHRQPENGGVVHNLNFVMSSAGGEFFKLFSHDDRVAPTFLGTCLAVIRQAPPSVVLVYARAVLIGPDGQFLCNYEDRLDLRSHSPAARLGRLVRNTRMLNVGHGVYRTRVMQELLPIRKMIGFDNLFFAELALRGQFWEIPERLFFRREHPDSFGLGADGLAGAARVIDPSGASHPERRPVGRLFLAHLAAIRRAPLSRGERLKAYVLYTFGHCWARTRHRLLRIPRRAYVRFRGLAGTRLRQLGLRS
jgi:glycosyltransferase involved in cell wall biosynthesis